MASCVEVNCFRGLAEWGLVLDHCRRLASLASLFRLCYQSAAKVILSLSGLFDSPDFVAETAVAVVKAIAEAVTEAMAEAVAEYIGRDDFKAVRFSF